MSDWIRVYVDDLNMVYVGHSDLKLNATVLTDQQLAELKQEIWDAAREGNPASGECCACGGFFNLAWDTLEDYESKKDGQDG
jgi:hypothetical protein